MDLDGYTGTLRVRRLSSSMTVVKPSIEEFGAYGKRTRLSR